LPSSSAMAVVLLVVSGGVYRWAAHRLARPPAATPLTSAHLAALPLRLGAWEGAEASVDEAIIEMTETDAHVNRFYRLGGHVVELYVAYGLRPRDLAPHRPEVCYPAAGWTLRHARRLMLAATDGTEVPCTIYQFDRGHLNTECRIVLNYYLVGGRPCPNAEAIRSVAWRGQAAVSYLAQVQITCRVDGLIDPAVAERRTGEFLRLAAPEIADLFEQDISTEGDP